MNVFVHFLFQNTPQFIDGKPCGLDVTNQRERNSAVRPDEHLTGQILVSPDGEFEHIPAVQSKTCFLSDCRGGGQNKKGNSQMDE